MKNFHMKESQKPVIHVQSTWEPIRIKVDYSPLSSHPANVRTFLETNLIPVSIALLKSSLKVQPIVGNLIVDPIYKTNTCGTPKIQIPSDHTSVGVADADVIFYISATNEPGEGFLAYASTCGQLNLNLPSNRPISAYVNYNLHHLNSQGIFDGKPWFNWIDTTIHEMTHSLVFSPDHYPKFSKYPSPIFQEKDGRTWFTAPNLVEMGKTYFGCEQLTHLPLENEGGSGSKGAHWERTTFGNEEMTASDMHGQVFSQFTMGLYEASGWYQVDYSKAGNLTWGKGQGCPLAEGNCGSNKEEFCAKLSDNGCSFDYDGFGTCVNHDTFSATCPYWQELGNGSCISGTSFESVWTKVGGKIGTDSRCWANDLVAQTGVTLGGGDKINAGCFQSKCENNKPSVSVNGVWYNCQSEGQVLTVGDGTITCPNIDRFCRSKAACLNGCTARGNCVNGQCQCYQGYSGADCSTV